MFASLKQIKLLVLETIAVCYIEVNKQKRYLFYIIKIAVSLLVLIYISQKYPIQSWLTEISLFHVLYFVLITFILIILSAIRLKLLFALLCPVSFSELVKITFIAQFVGLAFPSSLGKDSTKLWYLCSKNEVDKSSVIKTLIVNRAIALVAVLCVGSISLFHLLNFEYSIVLSFLLISIVFFVSVFLMGKKCMALAVSMLMVAITVAAVSFYIEFILNQSVSNELILSLCLFPAVEILPISWHGFGVSHLGLQEIVKKFSLNGFQIYNAFFLGKIVAAATGVFPYLLLKKSEKNVS